MDVEPSLCHAQMSFRTEVAVVKLTTWSNTIEAGAQFAGKSVCSLANLHPSPIAMSCDQKDKVMSTGSGNDVPHEEFKNLGEP